MFLLQMEWDPIKYIDLGFFKLHFYSLMWIVAFVIGLLIMKPIFKKEGESKDALDALFIYSVLAIMLGARLGHVIFYQSELITEDFFSIFLPFKFKGGFEFTGFRGLASHGAAIGMIIAMYLYRRKYIPHRSWLWILDRIVIPVAIGAIFIRLGNFINSEIVGKYTNSEFGVVFVQNSETLPRHPAQLYEAFCYIFVFLILLYFYWRTKMAEKQGFLFGSFLVLLWSVRFFVEYVKKNQGGIEDYFGDVLSTGQILSIPLILIGLYFMFVYKPKASSL